MSIDTSGLAFPKPSKAERRALKRRDRRAAADKTSAIYTACHARAGGRCENPDCPDRNVRRPSPVVMDHWLGGRGRRKAEERVETCWMLCIKCNQERTDNKPSARIWNDRFARHAHRYGYDPCPHYSASEVFRMIAIDLRAQSS